MCEGGTVRSVAMAYSLKYSFGQDALACSWAKNSPETIALLCEWADWIIVLQEKFTKYIPENCAHKMRVFDVGPDRWGNPLNKELVEMVSEQVQKWSNSKFEL